MAGPRQRLPSESDRADALAAARGHVAADAIGYVYASVQRDLFELGYHRNREVRALLLTVLDNEIKPDHYNGESPVPAKSWEIGFEDSDVWQFVWCSQTFDGRLMFIKFCLRPDGVHLMSFHESTRRTKGGKV